MPAADRAHLDDLTLDQLDAVILGQDTHLCQPVVLVNGKPAPHHFAPPCSALPDYPTLSRAVGGEHSGYCRNSVTRSPGGTGGQARWSAATVRGSFSSWAIMSRAS